MIYFILLCFCLSEGPILAGEGQSGLTGPTGGQMLALRATTDPVPELLATQVRIYIYQNHMRLWLPPEAMLPLSLDGSAIKNVVNKSHLAKLVQKLAGRQGVDPLLVLAVIRRESGFNSLAVSPKGAMGLMQLMPETAAQLGVEDPFNIEQNLTGGIRFLKLCLNRFNQNVVLALAAYNAGPERVDQYQGLPPFAETQNFVSLVMQDYCGEPVNLARFRQPAASPVLATPLEIAKTHKPRKLLSLPFFSRPPLLVTE